MDKILVTVVVPSLGLKYDVLLPKYMKVEDITHLLSEVLVSATNHSYISSDEELLCWDEKGIVLSMKKTISDYGIQNGDLLYLF